MGLSNSKPEKPLPAQSVVNPQEAAWGDCYCGHTGAQIPHWTGAQMSSTLVAAGLTQSMYENEIVMIHQKARDFIQARGDSCRYYWWMGLVLAVCIVIGFAVGIALIDSNYLFVMFGVLGFAIMMVYIFNAVVFNFYLKGWDQCLEHIQKYIDTELNGKYVDQGVAWMMKERAVWQGCGKNVYKIKYYDIVVYPGRREYSPPETGKDGNEKDALL